MKIIIKTLQGKQLPIEVEESNTVIKISHHQCLDSLSQRENLSWA